MTRTDVRVLLLADTHLGFDDPLRPRVTRRRRGPDFFAAYETVLRPALRGEADLVVHGGDLLFRSRVPAGLVARALAPLARVADAGVPVFLVPGNHERSRIPFALLARHEGVSIFDRPRTFHVSVRGVRVALAGFPFARVVGGRRFGGLVRRTGAFEGAADVRLLCVHQVFEGARVGAHEFTFRHGPDVVPGAAVPRGFAAVLAGHVHRAQVLTRDLAGRPLAAPVVYPGSVERTSFAERAETKGFWTLGLAPASGGGRLASRRFTALPTRPMVVAEVDATGCDGAALRRRLHARLGALPPDAVVRLVVTGAVAPDAQRVLASASLRRLAPSTMNVERPRGFPRRGLAEAAP